MTFTLSCALYEVVFSTPTAYVEFLETRGVLECAANLANSKPALSWGQLAHVMSLVQNSTWEGHLEGAPPAIVARLAECLLRTGWPQALSRLISRLDTERRASRWVAGCPPLLRPLPSTVVEKLLQKK